MLSLQAGKSIVKHVFELQDMNMFWKPSRKKRPCDRHCEALQICTTLGGSARTHGIHVCRDTTVKVIRSVCWHTANIRIVTDTLVLVRS